jgi:hypothetical protein
MNKRVFQLFLIASLVVVLSCNKSPYLKNNFVPPPITVAFRDCPMPPAPDYSNDISWAALPWKKDLADSVPLQSIKNQQDKALADVFFIHPTLFLESTEKMTYKWNADILDTNINNKVDFGSILNQASVFNGSCRVFAPRYRQAHISSFFTEDRKSGEAALNLAYDDVKEAFLYYLKHYNEGRPFIIAGHSQGTRHAGFLLKETLDNKELQKSLIAAYLIGMPVPKGFFENIPVCSDSSQTGCFVTWATYLEGFYPDNYMSFKGGNCVNPLSWKIDTVEVDRKKNLGGITWKFNQVVQNINGAKIKDGILWVDKPHVPGRMLIRLKNFHVADYNLFWFNIRENVRLRVNNYFNNKQINRD